MVVTPTCHRHNLYPGCVDRNLNSDVWMNPDSAWSQNDDPIPWSDARKWFQKERRCGFLAVSATKKGAEKLFPLSLAVPAPQVQDSVRSLEVEFGEMCNQRWSSLNWAPRWFSELDWARKAILKSSKWNILYPPQVPWYPCVLGTNHKRHFELEMRAWLKIRSPPDSMLLTLGQHLLWNGAVQGLQV